MNNRYQPSMLFDETIITRLFAGRKEMFLKIADIFLRKGDKNIEDIKKMLEDGDIKSYTIAVHGVKGAASNLGFNALSQIAQTLEFAGKADNLDEINANMPEFENIYRATMSLVDELKNELNPL